MADSCQSAGRLIPECVHRCRWQPVSPILDPTVSRVIRNEHAACQIQITMVLYLIFARKLILSKRPVLKICYIFVYFEYVG